MGGLSKQISHVNVPWVYGGISRETKGLFSVFRSYGPAENLLSSINECILPGTRTTWDLQKPYKDISQIVDMHYEHPTESHRNISAPVCCIRQQLLSRPQWYCQQCSPVFTFNQWPQVVAAHVTWIFLIAELSLCHAARHREG